MINHLLTELPDEVLERIVGSTQGPSSGATCNALGKVVEGYVK